MDLHRFRSGLLRAILAIKETGTKPVQVQLEIPVTLHQDGRARPIVVRTAADESRRNPELIALLADARRWRDELLAGRSPSIEAITRRERLAKGMVSRILTLAWLAPDITSAVLDGTQPAALTPKHLRSLPELPLDWRKQRALLGFPAA